MSKIDSALGKFALQEIESALARRKSREKSVLSRLEKRRKRFESELRKVDEQIRALGGSRSKSDGKNVRVPNARRLNQKLLADVIERLLTGRKTAIHYKELTETLLSRGLYRTDSKNFLSTVAVTLKRDKRFKKVSTAHYTLR